MPETTASRLARVRERIESACAQAGRAPESVKLIAVAKKHPAAAIREAVAAGASDIGESYVQELVAKQEELGDVDCRWHFIGRLQRNKVKSLVGRVELIHAVDSLHLGEEIGKRAVSAGVTQAILIAVNIAGEEQKSGVPLADAAELRRALAAKDGLAVRGGMTMPPRGDEASRNAFRALAELSARAGEAGDELSMGMSADLEIAIEEGATMVRVGTDIFGPRPT